MIKIANDDIMSLSEPFNQPNSYETFSTSRKNIPSSNSFFQCENGTLTEEICENGLAYDGHGNVYNHCNYNWAVDCGDAKSAQGHNSIDINFEPRFGPKRGPRCEIEIDTQGDHSPWRNPPIDIAVKVAF